MTSGFSGFLLGDKLFLASHQTFLVQGKLHSCNDQSNG